MNKKEQKLNNSQKPKLGISGVSGSVFTIKDMRKAYNAGVSRGVDNINKPTVDWTLNWHKNMFDNWFKEHYR